MTLFEGIGNGRWRRGPQPGTFFVDCPECGHTQLVGAEHSVQHDGVLWPALKCLAPRPTSCLEGDTDAVPCAWEGYVRLDGFPSTKESA